MSKKFTRKKTEAKPKKPRKDFPLFPHSSGMWAKKIKGRLEYFTSWRLDPKGEDAERMLEHFLKTGRKEVAVEGQPGQDSEGLCTLRVACNDFLATKQAQLDAGELSPRSFRDYFKTCEILIEHFGKGCIVGELGPLDFRSFRTKLAKRFSPISLRNEITRIRTVFRHADRSGLIDRPVKFGNGFDKPTAKTVRKDRNAAGPKLFERDEIVRILDACDPQLKAMVLLGINGGLGNTDVSDLHESRIDFASGWLVYPRKKTEIPRRIPLWPETLQSLREWLPERPEPSDPADSGLVFLTAKGNRWVRVNRTESGKYTAIDSLSPRFKKLLRRLYVNGRRSLGFYCLRHCFETYAGESRDQVAVDAVMGHVDPSMGANYRHRISDERLHAAVNVVRDWLFAETPDQSEGGDT